MHASRIPQPPQPHPWPEAYPDGYAVVDVETTGLGRDDRIVSAAVYRLDARGDVQDHWYSPVNPQRDPGPVWIHGLTSAMLDDAPLFPEIAATLAERLDGRVLVAHNAVFDWSMLAREYARANSAAPVEHRLCTIVLSKELRLPLANHKLESLAAHYGVVQQRAHHALDDARVLAEAFRPSLHLAAEAGLRLPLHACSAADRMGRRRREHVGPQQRLGRLSRHVPADELAALPQAALLPLPQPGPDARRGAADPGHAGRLLR